MRMLVRPLPDPLPDPALLLVDLLQLPNKLLQGGLPTCQVLDRLLQPGRCSWLRRLAQLLQYHVAALAAVQLLLGLPSFRDVLLQSGHILQPGNFNEFLQDREL